MVTAQAVSRGALNICELSRITLTSMTIWIRIDRI